MMRPTRNGLSALLALSLASGGCAAGGGSAGPAPAEARADGTLRVQNQAEAQRLMIRRYPRLLREAGTSGEAEISLTVLPDGSTTDVRVERITHDLFREPAVLIGGRLRFSPPGAARGVRVRLRFHPRTGGRVELRG